MQAFEVLGERRDKNVRVQVAGEVDLATVPRVAACLGAHAPAHGEAVELDLSGVSFIDSTGVHLLMRINDEARSEGWTLTIAPSDAVRRIVHALGLEDALPIQPRSPVEASSPQIAA